MAGLVEVNPDDVTFLSGAYADKMAASCNLVKVYKNGNTTVRFFDGAYANKPPPKEVDGYKIFPIEVIRTLWKCVEAARAAGKDI